MKRALLTGITGQDSSYLAELLLSKGHEVHGLIRRASTFNTGRIEQLYVDPHDPGAMLFCHLGAQSHVQVSFEMPEYPGHITGLGTTRILQAIRRSGIRTKFYQASSSEMFGGALPPQSEHTPFQPRGPYGAAKAYA
jgi:GDPmannose 4,6-dehydratase